MPSTLFFPVDRIQPSQILLQYSEWIYFIVIFIFFISISGITLRRHFEKPYVKPLILAVGLMMTIGVFRFKGLLVSLFEGWGIVGCQSAFKFCHLDGPPLKRFDTAWKRALDLAGIKDLHFHDLRHTFCSNLIISGGGIKDAKEMIGHKDISMTDRYSHLTNGRMLALQKQLAAHYETHSNLEQGRKWVANRKKRRIQSARR